MVKINKIYTKTGDDGTTGLVNGARIAKSDPLMAAIGDVDELNSAIGMARAIMAQSSLAAKALYRVQNDLFDLGADLATPADDAEDFSPSEMILRMIAEQTLWLESQIDELNADLEPLSSFILPGGSPIASSLHLARSICRRAERSVATAQHHHRLNPEVLRYINRLSDYLFVMARWVNRTAGGDPLWQPGASRA